MGRRTVLGNKIPARVDAGMTRWYGEKRPDTNQAGPVFISLKAVFIFRPGDLRDGSYASMVHMVIWSEHFMVADVINP